MVSPASRPPWAFIGSVPFYNGSVTPEPVQVASAFSALSGHAVLSVQQLSGGSSISSWRVVTARNVYAARLYPSGNAAAAYDQARLLTYLRGQRYPVPEIVLVGTYEAQHLLVLSWVGKGSVVDMLRASPDQAKRLGWVFGEVHAQLHTIPVTNDMWATLPVVEAPVGVPSRQPVLLHLDFHPLNVLTDGRDIVGVIDWENVRLGDACLDVARSLSILCADPSLRLLPKDERFVVRQFRRAYLNAYQNLMGRDALIPLTPFLAWAGEFMVQDLQRLDHAALARVARWASWWRRQTDR